MRVILDTNVLISGIFFSGPPANILRAWRDGKVQLVVSTEILQEYYEVGKRLSRRYPGIDMGPVLTVLARNSEWVEAAPLPAPVSNDADDDKFLACALASRTEVIISGDDDLLGVSGYRNLRILTQREFVDTYIDSSGAI